MKKRYKIAIVLVLIISIALYIISVHVLPYAIIQPQRIESVNHLKSNTIYYEDINVNTFDSINLKGFYVKALQNPLETSIILVHGIGGCKEHFTELSIQLANKGYDVWLFDNRAHGKSGGLYSTYGFYEKKDIAKIVDKIKEKTPTNKVGIWGNSLGGAIAIQALEYDKRIEFGLIESTFSDLRQIVYDYQKRFSYGIGLKFLSNVALNKAGKIANFNPDEVSPIASVSKIYQPVLLTHGDADENINIEYGKDLFRALVSKDKEQIIVKGGGHFGLFETGGENYKRQLFNFLEKQSKD